MMSFNGRAKSALLALTMIASSTQCNVVADFCTNNAVVCSMLAAGLMALKVRLDTKQRCHYTFDNWQQDIAGVLSSYNVFNPASRATIMNFIDKYFVGAKFKRVDTTTRTKEDDGTVVTVKGTKVVQKPSGFMGNIDAYVFQQLEADNKLLPAVVAMYFFIAEPQKAWNNAYNAASTPKNS